jgi:poly(3-hydroxyalkanoate) synthetase
MLAILRYSIRAAKTASATKGSEISHLRVDAAQRSRLELLNNYLLGNTPPPFDILYWNADTTRLPAKFHAELIDAFAGNTFNAREH